MRWEKMRRRWNHIGRAIQINPQLGQAWYLRGLTLMNAFQRYEEAIPFLAEAVRLGWKEANEPLMQCQASVSRR